MTPQEAVDPGNEGVFCREVHPNLFAFRSRPHSHLHCGVCGLLFGRSLVPNRGQGGRLYLQARWQLGLPALAINLLSWQERRHTGLPCGRKATNPQVVLKLRPSPFRMAHKTTGYCWRIKRGVISMLHGLHGAISVQRAGGRKGDAWRYTDFNRSLPPAEASRPSSQVRRPPLPTHSMPA